MADDEELEPEEAVDEDGQESPYTRRNARLRQRMARWLADSPFFKRYPRQLVRLLVELDDAAAVAHDAYVNNPSDPVLIKAYVAIAQRREVVLKLMADSSGSE